MNLEEDLDIILFCFAEAGFDVELDKEWMKAAYRAEKREERQNRTYYERIAPWDGSKDIIDPKSISRIVDALDQRAITRLKSFKNYVRNHCPELWKILTLVLKNGANRRFDSYLAILKDMLEAELLRRQKRALLPPRSKPRLMWRGKHTRRKETNS